MSEATGLETLVTTLHTLTIPPKNAQPRGAIVILHGWGANAQSVQTLANFIQLPDCWLIFADAPFPHPYAPDGRMWYDFPSDFRFQSSAGFSDRADLSTSRQQLTQLLQTLPDRTHLPLSQTLLGGFSQGGAMTLDVGLNLPLAGLMVLSGYLHAPLRPQVTQFPPILLVHGRQDTVVPLAAAHQARSALEALNVNLRYQEYDMGHEISLMVLQQMQIFVKDVLENH